MILVLAIILFIIFLFYSIKPGREEYTLEGLKLSWKNKASIEGVVTKWIVTLKDSSGNVIHTYENNESKNLKNFTDVTMNIVDKKEFDDKIIGNNTLELYYNEVKPDTKLYTKTVTFTQDDFGMTLDMNNLEEIDIPEPPPPPITEIPYQIPSATATDGWCLYDGKTVHQDVPGCGRICSSWEYIGSKNKGSWGLWGGNQNGIDCPAAKLDQVWKLTGGSTSGRPNRELAIGKYSESSQPTYTKKENTMLWSSRKLDLDSGYDKKGNGGTLAGKDWKRSRWRGYPDECKKKCDSFPKCKGFVHYKGKKWCYLKSSNDLGKTSSHSKFDFYYK